MKAVGLITEYNPFHKGHEYHIQKAKEITDADYVIAVMSGDYVQRGTPACVQKHTRAHMALVSGVDLVLELPIIYATGSAEIFAEGTVSILDKLGIVESICFGSECGTAVPLMEIAKILADEPEWYRAALQEQLRNGLSYPAARAAALPEYAEILSSPNNILGIEYCKALLRLDSKIKPVSIARKGSLYHESELGTELPSATAIRTQLYNLYNNEDSPNLSNYIPANAWDILSKEIDLSSIMHEDDFSQILLYRLLSAKSPEELAEYEDVSDELASRIFKCRMQFISFSQFADLLKTKEVTRTRINRALLHIILDVKKGTKKASYARILGFRKDAGELLSAIKVNSQIPFFSKTATADGLLDAEQQELFDLTTDASLLYEGVLSQKVNRSLVHEHSKSIIIV